MYTFLTTSVDAAQTSISFQPSGQNLFSLISPRLENHPAAPYDGGHS